MITFLRYLLNLTHRLNHQLAMKIEKIHSYLVHAGKHLEDADQQLIKGTDIPLKGTMHDMLKDIFDQAPNECKHEIVFSPTNGVQQNDCRDLVLKYVDKPTLRIGGLLAMELQK